MVGGLGNPSATLYAQAVADECFSRTRNPLPGWAKWTTGRQAKLTQAEPTLTRTSGQMATIRWSRVSDRYQIITSYHSYIQTLIINPSNSLLKSILILHYFCLYYCNWLRITEREKELKILIRKQKQAKEKIKTFQTFFLN